MSIKKTTVRQLNSNLEDFSLTSLSKVSLGMSANNLNDLKSQRIQLNKIINVVNLE